MHFILIRLNYSLEKVAKLYNEKISSLHGILSSIISDMDLRFTLKFWESLQKALGTNLHLSYAYPPQADGQIERTIQS